MNDPDAAVEEADRAVRQLGAAGCLVYTNVAGAPLSEPRFRPIFEQAAQLDRPIWLHPIRGPEHADYGTEARSEHEIWFTFGWPYETAAAMARLVYSGLFDRLPQVKIITHHLGGMVPYVEGKISIGFRQAAEGTAVRNPVAEEANLARPLSEYFRMFYADTAVNGVRGSLDCGLAFFGPERCLFASDAPFDPQGGAQLIAENLRMIRELEPAARDAILDGNAARLIGLHRAGATPRKHSMAAILIVYGTTEGQTAKIAQHIADRARHLGHDALVRRAPEAQANEIEAHDAVIVGGSLHEGRYQR